MTWRIAIHLIALKLNSNDFLAA